MVCTRKAARGNDWLAIYPDGDFVMLVYFCAWSTCVCVMVTW